MLITSQALCTTSLSTAILCILCYITITSLHNSANFARRQTAQLRPRIMAFETSNQDAAAQKTEETKQYGQHKAGEAHQASKDAAGATQDKANQAGSVTGEKWEQTKQASSDAAQDASEKAGQAKEGAGSLLQQAGDAASNAVEAVKQSVNPNNSNV